MSDIYTDPIWELYDAYIEIGDMSILLGGQREVIADTCTEVFEEVDDGAGTQEVICGASNYQDISGGNCLKGVKSMVYDILDKT